MHERSEQRKNCPGKFLLGASILNESFFHSHFLRCCSPVTVVYAPSDHLYFCSPSFSLALMFFPLPSFFTQFFRYFHRLCEWCVLASFSLYLSLYFLRLKYGTQHTHSHASDVVLTHTKHNLYDVDSVRRFIQAGGGGGSNVVTLCLRIKSRSTQHNRVGAVLPSDNWVVYRRQRRRQTCFLIAPRGRPKETKIIKTNGPSTGGVGCWLLG